MEQATDAEKAMSVSEFLDFKRRNKVCITFYVINIGSICLGESFSSIYIYFKIYESMLALLVGSFGKAPVLYCFL